jgi:Kdo2-lipid IVA lauroyltransferase/acyltransferase
LRQWIEYEAFKIILGSLRWTPLWFAHFLARFYVRLFDKLLPRFRRIAYRNLEIALPDVQPSGITNGVFDSIARMLVVFSRFPDINKSNIKDWIRYEGFEHYVDAKRRGRGVLFATAHMGAWELSAFAHAVLTEPMHIVIRPLDNSAIDSEVSRRRSGSGNKLIAKKDAARSIFRALHRNEAVGVLIDQNVSPDEGVFIDFFGVAACAGSAFVRMAHKSGAAVIPGYALWSAEERRYILRFYPVLEFTNDVYADTQLLHRELEKVIRQYPEQWLWIHRRWKTRPAGEITLY